MRVPSLNWLEKKSESKPPLFLKAGVFGFCIKKKPFSLLENVS